MQKKDFNKEEYYELVLKPKIQELRQLCNQENMPMFIAVCVANEKGKTKYEKEAVSAVTHEIKLYDDYIPKLINVTLGFDTVLPQSMEEYEVDN